RERIEKKWYRKRRIGKGAFAEVWLEVRHENDEKRAVKIIDKEWMEQLKVDYKKELLAMSMLSKPQYQQEEVLVKFFGWYYDPLNLFLSMEYFELGDLERHLTEPLTEDEVKDITTDVLNGLRIIHGENFAHRDVKPGNIFVAQKPPSASWWVKIGDFGISKRVASNITAFRTRTGTPVYQAPEIDGFYDTDDPTSVYDKAVDIWSLGCVVYKIATQKVPFPRSVDIEAFCDGDMPFPEEPLSAVMGKDGVEFVKSLIVPNPRERLCAECALESSWLSQRETESESGGSS
ncbi:kinase-like domain-containing protein, partial [Phaeosphaeriaceae sp. PMI808]